MKEEYASAYSSLEVMILNITNVLRKNIGLIVTTIGFMLLCIITFGDLGEIVTEEYWKNVGDNITSISFVSIGLTLVQVAMKQGLAEQALQRGLNTEKTTQKYEEHKDMIRSCNEKMIYLPYFLQIYNRRHTHLRKQEYLINNNYSSESTFMKSASSRAIKLYEKIIVNVTASSIKWSTLEISYNKEGRIITLDEYRKQRLVQSVILSFMCMIGVTFLAGGLFFSPSTEPLWQKFVKLFTYTLAILMTAIFTVVREYEKGAFGVPNELDEINRIWQEFKMWEIPEWVSNEINRINQNLEVNYGESTIKFRADISKEQEESENLWHIIPDSMLPVPVVSCDILRSDCEKFGG